MNPNLNPVEAPSDLDLHEAVHDAIYDLGFVRESEVVVHVNVLNAEAELKGIVLTRIMHHAVVQAAASVPGIMKVIDNLITDTDIEMAVGQALWKALGSPAANISVMSYRGEVTLTGELPSADLVQQANEVASKVPGVINVIGRLTLPAS